jgi:very-short-patch-repair endonuclease
MPVARFKNSRKHRQRAKDLRRHASLAEALLWRELLSLKKQTGFHFRRQHPLYPYIADFACTKTRLIIELDGASHDTRLVYDAKRDAALRNRGWTIIRFMNDDVLSNLEGVVFTILEKNGELSKTEFLPARGEDAKT